ncbi:MAG: phosphate transporter substrate-binding protein [Moraxellaceae bacterium]|jgi:ABC-type phosphate transport system substrate-binding protein|nr:phosphate transporter substrate-binding protein [Moraxellaceae bacterium]
MNFRFLMATGLLSLAAAAQGELVMVANPGISVGKLPLSQVSRIFLGQTEQLPDGSKAVPLNVSGATEDEFAREILKKSPEQIERYWARMVFTGKAKPPRTIKRDEVKALVASTPGAISYLDRSQVDGSVKIIAIFSD